MFMATCSQKSAVKGFTYTRVADCQCSYLPSIYIDQPKLWTGVWPSNFEYNFGSQQVPKIGPKLLNLFRGISR